MTTLRFRPCSSRVPLRQGKDAALLAVSKLARERTTLAGRFKPLGHVAARAEQM